MHGGPAVPPIAWLVIAVVLVVIGLLAIFAGAGELGFLVIAGLLTFGFGVGAGGRVRHPGRHTIAVVLLVTSSTLAVLTSFDGFWLLFLVGIVFLGASFARGPSSVHRDTAWDWGWGDGGDGGDGVGNGGGGD
jgi:hypothetical protein